MRKLFLTLISILALGVLVACGGGSSNSPFVPSGPTGGNNAGFTNASLKGTYVFTVNGIDRKGNLFAVAGVFTADGNGSITSGTRDTVNDARGQTLGEAISGSYVVNQDGRGQAVLTGNFGQSIYPFVLSSPSAGKLFQDGTTSNSVVTDAVGQFELQTSTSKTLAGTYIVFLNGEDSNLNPYGAVGGLTVSGASLAGAIDENDDGVFTPTFSSAGSYTLTGTSGTANFTTPTGGTHHFNVYYVSPSRLELIATDTNFFLYGYADLQTSVDGTTATFIGDQVFNISGSDANGPVVETGRFTLNGTAATVTNAVEDYNENATFVPAVGFGGTYSVTSNGRWSASLTNTLGDVLVGWQVSPQQSLVLVYNLNANILESGDMRAQTLGLSNANVKGNYAQTLSGVDVNLGYFECTGNYLGDGDGNLAGTIDYQTDEFGLTENSSQTGFYSVDPTTGRSTSTGNISGVDVIFYTVDTSSISVISADPTSAYQGTLTLQSADE